MKLTQSLQYGGNVCVLLNYLITLTLIILANTLTIITIQGVKMKFVDLPKLGINVDSLMTNSILMCSLSLAIIIFNFILLVLFIYQSQSLSGDVSASMKGIEVILTLISIVLLVFANKYINKDEDLVKSVDRIR